MALLRTVRGVGPRVAEAVVVHVGADPRRFRAGEQLANYAGLVPKLLRSGETSRLGHITRRGPALLRSLLVEAAWMVYRLNDWATLFVEKVSGDTYEYDGKRYVCGSKQGFLEATVDFALKHAEVGPAFQEFVKKKFC